MSRLKNLLGQTFSRLTVIARDTNTHEGRTRWLCQCECGNKTTVYGKYLLSGKSKSCGCFRKEMNAENPRIKHGHTSGDSSKRHSPTYNSWRSIIQRTTNPNSPDYSIYGGRGITVSDKWKFFINFLADMGERPGSEYSIDRINNNGNYEPENCKWSTKSEQNKNRRSYKQKETSRRNKEIRDLLPEV